MNGFLHTSWLPAVGWVLLHTLWEGALVALAAAAVLRVLRGSSPRVRYAVAVTALFLMAGMPFRHLASLRPSPPSVILAQGGSISEGKSLTRVTPTPTPTPTLRTRIVVGLERVLPWAAVIWAIGVCCSLLRLAGGWVWLQRLRWGKAELAPDELQRKLLDLCRRSGLKRAVTLLTCDGLAGPSVVGVLRPAILVPAGWFLNLPPDQVEALLAHELAHVLRYDYAVNLLQSLLEVVMFYHPGVWWLSRRIRVERELACDTFAASLIGDALPLAEALTTLELRGLGRASFDLAPAAHGGSLMERISHLLLPPRRTSSAPAFGAMAVMAVLLVSGLHMVAQTPDPTLEQPSANARLIKVPKATGVNADHSRLYIFSRSAKDAEGKDIPNTQLLDIKANQVPLNQLWKDFAIVVKDPSQTKDSQIWEGRDDQVSGPLVDINLTAVKADEVLAILHRLAKQFGVSAYQPPSSTELRIVKVTLAPVPTNPLAVICSAEIRDPATGILVFAPRILIDKGNVGRVSAGDSNSSTIFEVTVDKTGSSGEFTMTYSRAGEVVSIQKGKVPN